MLYSLDTSAFYTDEEYELLQLYFDNKRKSSELKTQIMELKDNKQEIDKIGELTKQRKELNKLSKELKKEVKNLLNSNTHIRKLRPESLKSTKQVSAFDSVLTRTLQLETNIITTDLIIVTTYYYEILKDLINSGFEYAGDKYVFYTASAGQIRTEKAVFIKELLLKKYIMTLMCGLTIERINNSKEQGVNINKYLAYLALSNSATDEWVDFNIDRVIVVEDFDSIVTGEFDHINDINFNIERKKMGITIEHTDGCGMILPSVRKKPAIGRAPWIKGLILPFPFDKFTRERNREAGFSKYGLIKDIYGKEYDILKDKIEIILTKSQFKMWKYYESWDEYKMYFKLYKCQAGLTNEEEDNIKDAKIGYQMLQSLSDMTDDELVSLTSKTVETMKKIGSDKNSMLKVLGVGDWNKNKNYFQQALEIYPELLKDTYSKETLKQVKKKIFMNARAGKIYIDGKYTYVSPDLYAFCERLILGEKNPNGLLRNGEVYCNLYPDDTKLDVLRSPSLYIEHAVRLNKINKEMKRWFVTKAIYTSCHDSISRILQFDVDGDKLLVCREPKLVEIAERNMKGVVPLYYEMKKAAPTVVNNDSIYEGLEAAYKNSNIGEMSNNITKVWNSEDIDTDIIKIMVMLNNFIIDYAKTLYKPDIPEEIEKRMKIYPNQKLPHFMKYDTKKINQAKKRFEKDKTKSKQVTVEPRTNSPLNRLEDIVPNFRLNFNAANLGTFNYKMLMSNNTYDQKDEIRQMIIDEYTKRDQKKHSMEFVQIDDAWASDCYHQFREIREQILTIGSDIKYVVDILVEYLYKHKDSSYKSTLWSCFGDVIVENIKNNLQDGLIQCQSCGERTPIKGTTTKYCRECSDRIKKEKTRERVVRHRSKTV